MENQRLHVHSLFFPDTQQAQLVQEQHRFRLLLQKMTGRLFDFFPPCAPLFCAFLRTEADAVLQAGPPENANGWIVRPLHTGRAFSFAEEHAQAKAQREQFAALADLLAASCGKGNSPQRIPPAGIPLPPAQPAFILGFAGENAPAMADKTRRGMCIFVENRKTGVEKTRRPVFLGNPAGICGKNRRPAHSGCGAILSRQPLFFRCSGAGHAQPELFLRRILRFLYFLSRRILPQRTFYRLFCQPCVCVRFPRFRQPAY